PTGYQSCTVTKDNSCTVMNNDDRSADKLGHTTLSMGSDNNVRGYASSGGATLVVNNSGNGAVASGGFKGPGEQRSTNVEASNVGSSASNTASSSGSMPTLENVTIGGSFSRPDDSFVPGDWSTSMNGRILNAENAQYNDEEEQRNANGMIKGFYAFQGQMIMSQFSGDAPGGGLAGGVGVLRTAGMAEEASQGYRSFSAFKRAEGAAGPGMQWHHVVEQTPGNVAQFGAETIHNTENLIRLDTATHRQISGFYSSKALGNDMTVRQWLRIQSYEDQRAFGQQALRDFGGGQ
ncbi:MAG: hypothetical protein ABIQ70_06475, partial [Dokdonella sp.]